MEAKRRKMSTDNTLYGKNWEITYLFIEYHNQPQCLVCYKKFNAKKGFNIKRHYQTHSSKYDKYQNDERSLIFQQLKSELQQKQSYFINSINKADCATEASFSVALEIAKSNEVCGDGELIKRCAMKMAKCFSEHKVAEKFQTVSLSHETLNIRIDDLNEYCEEALKLRIKNCMRYGLAFDCDLTQLLIILRSVDDDLNVTEELLDLVELDDETRGIDIFEVLNESFESYEKLSSVATDASAVMCDINGLAGVLKERGIETIMLHCINMSSLCAKSHQLNNVMIKVVRIINFLRGNESLCYGKLKDFLEEDIPSDSSKRWFSAGKCLESFYSIVSDIILFLEEMVTQFNIDDLTKAREFIDALKDYEFLQDFAFLCDITSKVNQLNLMLQRKNQTVSNLVAEIDAFQCKLKLWKNEIIAGKLDYFPLCLELSKTCDGSFQSMSEIIQTILDELEIRFVDFALIRNDLKLFNNPMAADIENQRSYLQMELCELQNDPFYLSMRTTKPVEFWKLLDKEKFSALRLFAAEILSMFGSTYQCEAGFNYIKNKYRTKLGNLKATMRLALNERDVDLKILMKYKK